MAYKKNYGTDKPRDAAQERRAYWANQKNKAAKPTTVREPHRRMLNPSDLQRAIFEDVESGTGHTVVMARAGSGKTSTIIESLFHLKAGKSWALVAFNKSIADELKHRAPPGGDVSTSHSFGLKAISRSLGKNPVINKYKCQDFAQSLFGKEPEQRELIDNLCKTVSLAKQFLFNTAEQFDDMIDQFGIESDFAETRFQRGEFIAKAIELLNKCIKQRDVIDFDDMIHHPNVHDLTMPQFDYVLVDEVQDMNRSQIEMIKKMIKPGGRLIAIGDDRQAIYQFRGADESGIDNLVKDLGAKVLPLSVTYRCCKSIVREANKYVPDLKANDSADEGSVEERSFNDMLKLAGPGDFIISRVNAPMIGIAMKFIKEGRACNIQGRDIGAGLMMFIKKSKANTVGEFRDYVVEWRDKEVERLSKKPRVVESTIDGIKDKASCLLALSIGAAAVDDVKVAIEKLFQDGDDQNKILIVSGHRSKGMERNRVWMLSETFKPGKSTAEDNLCYVSITRAKKNLFFVKGLKQLEAEE